MSQNRTIATLFAEKPIRWSLRGDPYLWEALCDHIGQLQLPDNEQQLMAVFDAAFEQLVGAPLSTQDFVFVERFSHGGMSSGMVDPAFWREQGLPLLLGRLKSELNG